MKHAVIAALLEAHLAELPAEILREVLGKVLVATLGEDSQSTG